MKVKYLAAVSPHQHRLFFPSTSSPELLNPAFLGQTTKPHHLKEKNIPTAPHHSRYGNSPKCDPNSQIPCPGGQRYPFHQLLGWMDADHSGQVVGKGLGPPPVPAHPCRGGGEAAGFGVLGLMPARWDGARDGSMVMGNDQTLSHLEAADIKINLKSTGERRKILWGTLNQWCVWKPFTGIWGQFLSSGHEQPQRPATRRGDTHTFHGHTEG